ncbi:hypothetical protein [Corynebacterium comes]|uniref:Uncharacterized protein n=1 Tax=Corynebacterium comes TaxID=2675218 RepID=A0A6B8VRJ3_9CORY|nr:hypothetical protein [Corynebacterium comes]QGU03964.1 hypothetical protein CETAM_03430 [Corynebacterium comes]
MTWTLALAVTPSGIGAAKTGTSSVPETTGYFPELDRAVGFSAGGESTPTPEKTVLVVEVGIPSQQLKWFLGELIIAGIPTGTIQVRSDVEVLTTAFGGPVLLVDADRETMVPPSGTGGEPLHAGRAGEIVEDTGTKVLLVGHEDVRGRTLTAFRDLDPVVLDRSDVARLALENPTTGSLLSLDPAKDPVAVASRATNRSVTGYMTILVVALAVVLALSFLF